MLYVEEALVKEAGYPDKFLICTNYFETINKPFSTGILLKRSFYFWNSITESINKFRSFVYFNEFSKGTRGFFVFEILIKKKKRKRRLNDDIN